MLSWTLQAIKLSAQIVGLRCTLSNPNEIANFSCSPPWIFNRSSSVSRLRIYALTRRTCHVCELTTLTRTVAKSSPSLNDTLTTSPIRHVLTSYWKLKYLRGYFIVEKMLYCHLYYRNLFDEIYTVLTC